MRSIRPLPLLSVALIAVALCMWRIPDRADGSPRNVLVNGAPSVDALVGRFLAALAAKDRETIERLRVDGNEYQRLILPGSVKPGQKPQIMPARKSEYFWGSANTTSVYSLAGIIENYGGTPYRLKRIEIPRVDRFAWYTAYRDSILHLEAEGKDLELQLGSIAEHDGRFKFISYYSD